jgi:hypothetical protein
MLLMLLISFKNKKDHNCEELATPHWSGIALFLTPFRPPAYTRSVMAGELLASPQGDITKGAVDAV